MIIVIPVIDSEGQAWKSGDRDIPQPRFPEVGNIRIEDIPEPGFGECECAFDALCKVLLLRFQMGEDPALDGEESGRDQPWRACYDISGELLFCQRIMMCQRMIRGADTGYRGGKQLLKVQGAFFLPFFDLKSCVYLLGFHHAEKRGKGYHARGRTQHGKLFPQFSKNVREKIQLHMIMAPDFKDDKIFLSAKPLFCGNRCFQDQLCIGQKPDAFSPSSSDCERKTFSYRP